MRRERSVERALRRYNLAMREVEIKIAVADADQARALLGRSGAVATTPRYFEDNRVYDDDRRTLAAKGELLRIRTSGTSHTLTFKEMPDARQAERQYKVRIEHECRIDDPDVLETVVNRLGFASIYRYQKFRQRYRFLAMTIELDETPIGVFLEFEGAPEQIDAATEALGFSKREYITKTYRALHAERAECDDPGDLVFPAEAAE